MMMMMMMMFNNGRFEFELYIYIYNIRVDSHPLLRSITAISGSALSYI